MLWKSTYQWNTGASNFDLFLSDLCDLVTFASSVYLTRCPDKKYIFRQPARVGMDVLWGSTDCSLGFLLVSIFL